ncbi:CLUMA_CG003138, isoform A [Clunio marinus]|uniref:CLUMA_CG003138, isoform A n=1 Tax=Clunio marinus TaxID=568069 RepID=A0A1J1HMU6_9DIPT|nr:CLUMA_CG003138, isoform A [Clunio marinus]
MCAKRYQNIAKQQRRLLPENNAIKTKHQNGYLFCQQKMMVVMSEIHLVMLSQVDNIHHIRISTAFR